MTSFPKRIPYLIAEGGTCHSVAKRHDRLARALSCVDLAVASGFDCVKFQFFVPDEPLFCPMPDDEERKERWDRSCMYLDDWEKVTQYARKMDIDFAVSVFQHRALEMAKLLKPAFWKVASRAADNFPYEKVNLQPVVISWHHNCFGGENTYYLRCVPKYPAPISEIDLSELGPYEGYSDHSANPAVPCVALCRGAKIVECHIKPHFMHSGHPDFAVSYKLDQLRQISGVRDVVAALE